MTLIARPSPTDRPPLTARTQRLALLLDVVLVFAVFCAPPTARAASLGADVGVGDALGGLRAPA